MSSAVSTRGACPGKPRSRKLPIRCRSVPSRRNAVAVKARTSARSRSGRVASSAVESRSSSRARRRRNTPSRISAASRRTANPGGSLPTAGRLDRLRTPFTIVSSFLRQPQGYAKSNGMPTPPSDPHLAAPPLSPSGVTATGGASSETKPLPEAARRALAEAAARRGETEGAKDQPDQPQAANEIGGRGGLDPTRYGDWEINGIASDF